MPRPILPISAIPRHGAHDMPVSEISLVLTILLCALMHSTALAFSKSFEAKYKLSVGPVSVGKMERQFELQSSGEYRFTSKIWATGLVSFLKRDELLEISEGIFTDGRILPLRYSYERQSKKKPRSQTIYFDHDAGQITTTYKGEQSSAALEPGTLDKLVYQAVLARDLASEQSQLRYVISDKGKQKVYVPVIGANEPIKTSIGEFDTVRVTRQETGSQRGTTLWCAPELDYLPVRVVHRDKKGNETVVTITDYRALQ